MMSIGDGVEIEVDWNRPIVRDRMDGVFEEGGEADIERRMEDSQYRRWAVNRGATSTARLPDGKKRTKSNRGCT